MRKHNAGIFLVVLLYLAFLGEGCCGEPDETTLLPTSVEAFPTPLTDCEWSAVAQAWLDADEDGRWDSNEAPLLGVRFFVDESRYHQTDIADFATSNLQGEAHLYVFGRCSTDTFEVYPEVPRGYRLVTAERISARGEPDEEFPFGFTYLPGISTATPRPIIPMSCVPYPLPSEHEYGLVEHMVVTSDNAVWGEAHGKGVFWFDWRNGGWTTHSTEDGLPSASVNAMAMSDDSVLWVGTSEGIASFDGATWNTYTTEDGLLSNVVRNIAIAPDGDIWFASRGGVSRLRPDTEDIVTYPMNISHASEDILSGAVTPDGSVWVESFRAVSRLATTDQMGVDANWMPYSYPDPRDFFPDPHRGIASSPDGTLWFVGSPADVDSSGRGLEGGDALASFDPSTEEWDVYSYKTTGGDLLGDPISSFAIAPDGSVWFGALRNGAAHLLPSTDGVSQAQIVYHPEQVLLDNKILTIALAPDGAVWFGIQGSIIRCVEKGD